MNYYQSIFNKYSQKETMLLQPSELLKDFSIIKPTFNPILDICILKTLGSYIYNITNIHKWQICPNLINEIIDTSHQYNIQIQDIIDIINKGKSKYKKPEYTINKVYYFVSDCMKENLSKTMSSEDDINKYFDTKNKYKDSLDMIKLNYTDKWKEIDVIYDTILDILCENFSELEHDMNFEVTTEIIESIGSEASKEVEKLINLISQLLKNKKINILSSTMEIYFDSMMDKIYEKVILSKNFDNYIYIILVDMYGVQKSIHRLSLSLEISANVLNMFLQKPIANY